MAVVIGGRCHHPIGGGGGFHEEIGKIVKENID